MDFMAQDHNRLDEMFKQFRSEKNTNLSEAEKLFSEFKAGLERHIVWEEEMLFPLFESRTGMRNEGPTAVMRIEHRQIKELLERIRSKIETKDTTTGDFENSLVDILSAHNQKEEGVLYPWFDNSLSAREREEALAKMEAPRSGSSAES
jgi:regulator of cell morphogenesis and NO signaling